MGARKHIKTVADKEAKKNVFMAKLNNCPTSSRKMRLLADLIRGMNVDHAMNILKYSTKDASIKLNKLLRSAIANWQQKNEGVRIEDTNLYVKTITVDSGRMLKRIQPAPQGRAHRIHKHSNHVTLVLDILNAGVVEREAEVIETVRETNVKETNRKQKKSIK